MTYEELITTVSEIVDNEKINKRGLILVYELPEKRYKNLHGEIFYKMNPVTTIYTPIETDEFEVQLGGQEIRFVKKIDLVV
jgi:hypothetical protein